MQWAKTKLQLVLTCCCIFTPGLRRQDGGERHGFEGCQVAHLVQVTGQRVGDAAVDGDSVGHAGGVLSGMQGDLL